MIFAQAHSSSGDIRGFVVDANGASIIGAAVSVTDLGLGLTRSTRCNSTGVYEFKALPPGRYRLKAEAAGFHTAITDPIQVRVGDSVSMPFQLKTSLANSEVVVTTQAPVIEMNRTQQSSTIDSLRLANLPINRRNYLDFALLTPGVVETNNLVENTDFRLAQTPQSGLSFGAGNGRGNTFLIDGVDNNTNSGGVRPGVSQEAVQEFQVNRNSYGPEFGGSHGGVIVIVTKAGTNVWHAGLFGHARRRNLQARNYFDPVKSDYLRGQYGGSVGGPLQRDRTFGFVSFERLDRSETAFVPLLWDKSIFWRLTPSQIRLLSYLDSQSSLAGLSNRVRNALTTTNYPSTLQLFEENSGTFPFDGANNQATARVDHNYSPRNSGFLRASFSRSREQNAQFGALVGWTHGKSVSSDEMSFAANHVYLPAPGWVSETRAQFSYWKLGVIPTDPNGPELDITGYGYFGRDVFQPSSAWERRYELGENISATHGKHHWKFGATANAVRDHIRSSTFFGGRFSFGQAVPLSSVLNSVSGDPGLSARLERTLNAPLAASLYAPITALQAFNLGLPTFFQQGFGDPTLIAWQPRVGAFVQDVINPTRGFTLTAGLRYEFERNPKPVNTRLTNFAPRLGFAWSPFGTNTVIRGGAGLFYSPVNAQIYGLPLTLDGVRITQAFATLTGNPSLWNAKTGQLLTAADIYKTFAAQGFLWHRPITTADLAQFGWTPRPNAPGRALFSIAPDFREPYSEQASLEVEHALGNLVISAAYIFNRGAHLTRSLDQNLFYAGRRADGQPVFGFKDPEVFQNNVLQATANSWYNALVIQASRRFSRGVAFNANYTWSKAIDEVTDFNSDFEPHDQLNAKAERAVSPWDMRHRFVLNAVLESPIRPGLDGGWRLLFSNWVLSPILSVNSGRPFNILTGFDNLGDNHPNTHRPLGLGRNAGRGPMFYAIDARIARSFPFGRDGRHSVEAIAEGFNLLNRTNFKTINNIVGDVTISELPQPITGVRANPVDPLSFSSAFDPRQFQLGLRVIF